MSNSKFSCLVTGGAGFIGSHVVEELVRLGHPVRVVDNLSTGDEANIAPFADSIEFLKGDLCDPAISARAAEGVEVVFHLAALPSVPRSLKDPWGSHDANVNATVRLLEACRAAGVRRVVYSSSSSVYGDTPTLPKVETMEPLPRSPYAASKLSSEQYVLAYARGGLMEAVALRYFNVFGPRQSPFSAYAAVIPLFLQAAATGKSVTVFGDGEQTRDFTYVSNVVQANLKAATAPAAVASGWPVNVGAGQRTSLNEMLQLAREVTGVNIPADYNPPRPGDVRDSLASLDRVSRLIGYQPTVDLREGLMKTWQWLQAKNAVESLTIS
ncbi:MAG TPA: NAD-dependent epimerase/dehydratase family protein, partial [Gemmatimonadaceae bacterium]|nr:NAD-dependent epimerase/dehydratase family protein [Gemmatimonadaceae bacterium]